MIHKKTEQGQALIIITFAIIGLIGLTGLTIDGGMAYSDRRHAQNAADSAALAVVLAHVREVPDADLKEVAVDLLIANGYDENEASNMVTVKIDPVTSGCPAGTTAADNRDFTVTVVSHVDTTFGTIVGIQQVTNTVTATTRACGTYVASLFDGNAVVSLNPSATHCGIDTGSSSAKKWEITGGGIFSNGCVEGDKGDLSIPDDKCISAVGTINVNASGPYPNNHACIQPNQTAKAYVYPDDILAMMPPDPCTGAVTAGVYAGGGYVPSVGQMTFNDHVYCIPDMTKIVGHVVLSNATLYVTDTDFDVKYNGGGDPGFSGTATTNAGSPYQGYYMIIAMAPVTETGCQQNIEMRGNGDNNLTGTIFAPSACFDAKGNSGTGANNSQFIFYKVSTNGNAKIKINFTAGDNHRDPQNPAIQLLK